MFFRFGKLVTMLTLSMLVCGLVSGCSSSGIAYDYDDMPDVHYYNVNLTLEVNAGALNALGQVASADIYVYDTNGVRIASKSNLAPYSQEEDKCFSISCSSAASTVTLDYFDKDGNFLGCSTEKLDADLGDDLYEDVDIYTLYNAATMASNYKLKLKEIDADTLVGGNVILEAILTTPCGEQIVTDNLNAIDWTSSNEAVLAPMSSGTFKAMGAGSAVLECVYNDNLSVSTTYTVTEV